MFLVLSMFVKVSMKVYFKVLNLFGPDPNYVNSDPQHESAVNVVADRLHYSLNEDVVFRIRIYIAVLM